jgi:hypothetical protein
MHAVVINVILNDREAVLRAVPDMILPRVKERNPELITGYITMKDNTGMGFWVLESEAAANTMREEVELRRDTLPPVVTLDSVEVREVVAQA